MQFILLNKKVNVNLTKYDFETLAINFSYLQTQNHIWEYNNPIIGYSILNIPEDKTLFQNTIEKGFNFFRNILESYFINIRNNMIKKIEHTLSYELQRFIYLKFLEKQGLKITKEDYTIEDEYCYLNFIL